MDRTDTSNIWIKIVNGFVAGFFATVIFHQLTLAVLWGIGVAPFAPFSMAATAPFGVPAFLSLAFWGGIWGIPLGLLEARLPHYGYWMSLFLLGAVFPSLVALLVVLPLKGKPLGGGWRPSLLLTAFLINGAWGVGTGLILKLLHALFGQSMHVTKV